MSQVDDLAAPAPSALPALSAGALGWMGRNLAFFDPLSSGSPLPPERRAKAALELAIVCHAWAKLKPATQPGLREEASALLRKIWADPAFLELIDAHGGQYAGAQLLTYAALAPDGVCDDLRSAALARARDDGYLSPATDSAYLRLETRYYADKANAEHGIEEYWELAARSVLARLPAPPVPLGVAYTMTHTAFYLSDYGSRAMDLPDGARARAERLVSSMIFSCAGQELWDLTGELVITAACLGAVLGVTPAMRAGLDCLARAQQESGAIPGRSAARRAKPCLTDGQFFRVSYHTTLVAVLIALIVG